MYSWEASAVKAVPAGDDEEEEEEEADGVEAPVVEAFAADIEVGRTLRILFRVAEVTKGVPLLLSNDEEGDRDGGRVPNWGRLWVDEYPAVPPLTIVWDMRTLYRPRGEEGGPGGRPG